MLGFRTGAAWKKILAITYYIMCFYGFRFGFQIGISVLITATVLPYFVDGVLKGFTTDDKKNFFVLPCFILAILISVMIFPFNEVEKSDVPRTSIQKNENNVAVQMTEKVDTEKPAATETSVPISEKNVTAQTAENGDTIVYISKSGKKYHKKDCSYVKDNFMAITLKEAEEEGKTPCSRCYK